MGVQHLKIVVAGRIGSGKREFVRAVAEVEVVATGGHFRFDSRSYSTPEDGHLGISEDDRVRMHFYGMISHLSSAWTIPRNMTGFVVLVDSTDERSLIEGRVLLLYMMYYPIVPFIVVANKQDLPGALTVEQVREKMRLPDRIPLMPCIAKERDSVQAVLLELIYTMPGL